MKLFLASEAKHPQSINDLTNFVGSFAGKRIAYIPTAANGEFWGSWKGGESVKTVLSLGAEVDIIELESNWYLDVITQIKKADIIWFPGGMTGYLLYWIRRVRLDKALPELLDNGAIYVGSSAGSMICSHTQHLAEIYPGEEEPGSGIFPGLGLIDFEIFPHFEDEKLDQIKQIWQGKQEKLYLIKNGEAITVVDGKVTVLSEERIVG